MGLFINTELREVKLGLHTLITTQQVLVYVSGQKDIASEISFRSHFPGGRAGLWKEVEGDKTVSQTSLI